MHAQQLYLHPRKYSPPFICLAEGFPVFCLSGNCQHFLLRRCLAAFIDLVNYVKLPVAQIRVLQTSGNRTSIHRGTVMDDEPVRVHAWVTEMKWHQYVFSGFTAFAA